jgi:uncharacterized membrane protein
MHSSLHYFPVGLPILLAMAALLGVLTVVVAVGLLRFASASMGIGAGTMLLLLLLALIGSSINCRNARYPARPSSAFMASPMWSPLSGSGRAP